MSSGFIIDCYILFIWNVNIYTDKLVWIGNKGIDNIILAIFRLAIIKVGDIYKLCMFNESIINYITKQNRNNNS